MQISKKLLTISLLSIGFMLVLIMIYALVRDRMDYAAAANLGSDDFRLIARSIKYGILIVLLTFGVFFMYELLKEVRIHPMQYILVGAALAIFYLLLLSFAEKIGFTLAYIIASVACITLIAWYLQFVLNQLSDHIFVSVLLSITYGTMYILLSLSEFSLLVGSILLFLILFFIMYFTRHINWYQLEQ